MPLSPATANPDEVLEVAPLSVREGQEAAFEAAFNSAQRLIASMPGYKGHKLSRCIERPNEFVLLVRWSTLAAHEVGFRGSAAYQTCKGMLHHFYEPLPIVSHYRAVHGVA